MSLDEENGDHEVDPWWYDDELLEIRREEQFYDLMEQQKRERQLLITRLDKQNSWNLVADFLAMQDENRPVENEDEMDQEFNEFLRYKLQLPGNIKAYLLYQFLLVRDFGICSCIVASLYMITGLVMKFVPYLTHR